MVSDERPVPKDLQRVLAEAEAMLEALNAPLRERPAQPLPDGATADAERAVKAVMMMMCEGAAMLDERGRVLYCNQHLADMLRRPAEALAGHSFAGFIAPSDAAKWHAAFGCCGVPAPVGFTIQVITGDRQPVPVHVALCSLGEPLGRVAFLVASDLAWQEARMRQLERMNRQLEEQREALEVAATTDSATGAYSAGAVSEVLETELAYARRYGYPVSVLLMDLDWFKGVNDTYGHAFGDIVLKVFCDRCRDSIRATDYLIRYGGDEFVVVLPQTGSEGAQAVGERILRAVREEAFSDDRHRASVTVSIGSATGGAGEWLTGADLLMRADQALYAVKRGGRNGIARWTPETPAASGMR